MAIFNAGKEGYLLARIDGRQVLFTSMRLDRATIPEGLYCYDIRDSDRLDGSFYVGTALCGRKPPGNDSVQGTIPPGRRRRLYSEKLGVLRGDVPGGIPAGTNRADICVAAAVSGRNGHHGR